MPQKRLLAVATINCLQYEQYVNNHSTYHGTWIIQKYVNYYHYESVFGFKQSNLV